MLLSEARAASLVELPGHELGSCVIAALKLFHKLYLHYNTSYLELNHI